MKASILETSRLILREMTGQDAESLLKVFGDEEVMQFYPRSFDSNRMKAWIDWNVDHYAHCGYGLWAMILRQTGEVVGDCGLIHQQVEETPEVEIGYHLRRDLWKQGFATEAASACRDYGFRVLKRSRLISLIHPQNNPSKRVAEKIGMRLVSQAPWKNTMTCLYAIQSAWCPVPQVR